MSLTPVPTSSPWSSAALVLVVDEIGRPVVETESLAVGVETVRIDVVMPVAVVCVVVVTPFTGAAIGVAVPAVAGGCVRTPLTVVVPTTVAGTFATATLYGCG